MLGRYPHRQALFKAAAYRYSFSLYPVPCSLLMGTEQLERLRSLVVALIRLGEQRGCVRLLSPEFAVWLAERRFVVQDVLDAAELAASLPGRARICMFGSTDDPFLQITAPVAPRSRVAPSAPSSSSCAVPPWARHGEPLLESPWSSESGAGDEEPASTGSMQLQQPAPPQQHL